MNFEEAKNKILDLLVAEGAAINDHMIKMLEGNKELFSEVRQARSWKIWPRKKSTLAEVILDRPTMQKGHHPSRLSVLHPNNNPAKPNNLGIAIVLFQ